MKLYSLNGTNQVASEDVTFDADADGGFDFPEALGEQLLATHLDGSPVWETAGERSVRLHEEAEAERRDPARQADTLDAILHAIGNPAGSVAAAQSAVEKAQADLAAAVAAERAATDQSAAEADRAQAAADERAAIESAALAEAEATKAASEEAAAKAEAEQVAVEHTAREEADAAAAAAIADGSLESVPVTDGEPAPEEVATVAPGTELHTNEAGELVTPEGAVYTGPVTESAPDTEPLVTTAIPDSPLPVGDNAPAEPLDAAAPAPEGNLS